MDIDKRIDMCMLLDVYGKVLTSRQYGFMIEFYEQDKNLVEIGEAYGVSRQAVRDALMVAEKTLVDLEQKLGVVASYKALKTQVDEIIAGIESNHENQQLIQKLKNLSKNL